MTKSVAIITARGGSKRIPGKNIRDFCGQPIIAYSIQAAVDSGCFDEVMVSTDDKQIAKIAEEFGAKIPFFRSEKNSDDFSMTADVLEEVVLEYKKLGKNFDHLCCIYPTAVFVTAEKLKEANQKFLDSGADSLIPVTRFSFPIQRALKINDGVLQFFWPENMHKRSQDLEASFHDCGQFYFAKSEVIVAQKKLFTSKTVPFEIKESEAQDIDNEEDWKIAEMKFKILRGL